MPKIALCQMLVEGGKPEVNLSRAVDRVRQAAEQGAGIVLLPEALDWGWTHPVDLSAAQPIPHGAHVQSLCWAARKSDVYVCAGLIERHDDKLYNSAVFVTPEGEVALVHRKVNELDIALDQYAVGGSVQCLDTEFGKVGVMICADGFAEGLWISRELGKMGAKLILSPCAWAVPAEHDQEDDPYGKLWVDSYTPVSREFELTVAAASCVGPITAGPWAGRNCIGCSMAIGPGGEFLATGPFGVNAEDIILVDTEHVHS